MEAKDFFYSLLFASALGMLLFLFGTSVTGNAVYQLCDADADCNSGVCCTDGKYGLCMEKCKTADPVKSSGILTPSVEVPKKADVGMSLWYGSLIILLFAAGFFMMIRVRR
ncbi:MAG: hypothetical protein HGA85_07805 [Nanoarchaeota archaeon]|nr:hypothetical protein [Nanoarchaeota archaeon]